MFKDWIQECSKIIKLILLQGIKVENVRRRNLLSISSQTSNNHVVRLVDFDHAVSSQSYWQIGSSFKNIRIGSFEHLGRF